MRPPATKPATAIASFWRRIARSAPITPQPIPDEQCHPLRRFPHEIRGDLKTNCEAERRDKKPEKSSPKQQDRCADDDADDGNGEVHGDDFLART